MKDDLIKAAEHMSDKGYELSTLEKQAEFAQNRESNRTMEKCFECEKPANYIRHTQFAGKHYYCTEHARLENDFAIDDSYTYWTGSEEDTEGGKDDGK